MRILICILVVCFSSGAAAGAPQESKHPLSQAEVMQLVKGAVSSTRVAELVRRSGISFEPTDEYYRSLRAAGAEQVLIDALRAATAIKPADPASAAKAKQFIKGANALMETGDLEGAMGLYRQAILESPSDGDAHRLLGIALGKTKDWKGDVSEQRVAILMNPDDAAAKTELAAALHVLSAGETSTLTVIAPPNAEVCLDDESKGQASSEGILKIDNLKPGTHSLRVSLPGKKDFQQSVAVTAGSEARVEARLEDLPTAPGVARLNSHDGLKYVWIPAGSFTMGCSRGDTRCDDEERPPHAVRITRGFWMSQLEVTAGAYKRFSGATGRPMPPAPIFNRGWTQDRLPMVKVTWNDARDYCTWASGRLPTEAEWEYGARGGSDQSLYGPLDQIAWYARNSASGGNQWGNPNPTGTKRANGFSLFDMLGNVFEWTNDWFDPAYYSQSPKEDPPGPSTGQKRVIRGRAWVAKGDDMRVSYRGGNPPDGSYYEGGFRCVCEALKP